MSLDRVDTCKKCGEHVRFLRLDARDTKLFTGTGRDVWEILAADGMSRHVCTASDVKVYSPEEKAEFQRRRLAGEI